jgi:hypothetical protein
MRPHPRLRRRVASLEVRMQRSSGVRSGGCPRPRWDLQPVGGQRNLSGKLSSTPWPHIHIPSRHLWTTAYRLVQIGMLYRSCRLPRDLKSKVQLWIPSNMTIPHDVVVTIYWTMFLAFDSPGVEHEKHPVQVGSLLSNTGRVHLVCHLLMMYSHSH